VALETPATTRAAELAALLAALQSGEPGGASRLAVLVAVAAAVSPHACPLSREVGELVDREVDALQRRRPLHTLAALRARTATLFSFFCDADPGAGAGQDYADAPPQPLVSALARTSLSTRVEPPPPPAAQRPPPPLRRDLRATASAAAEAAEAAGEVAPLSSGGRALALIAAGRAALRPSPPL
jgi:hypothetical protein